MADFSEARTADQEARAQFSAELDRLNRTAALDRSIEAAALVLRTLKSEYHAAPKEAQAEGYLIHVRPSIRTGVRVTGEFFDAHPAHDAEPVLGNPEEEVLDLDSEPFVGNRMVVGAGGRLIVVDDETGRGCEVPEPPTAHLMPVPREA